MKRFFSLLLIITLILTICPSIGIADNVRQSGDFFYKIKGNGTAAITGYAWPGTVEDIYIPRMLDGYTVSSVLSFPCNPHHQQNKWDSPVLHGCGNKVAPDLMSFLQFVMDNHFVHDIFDGEW